MSNADRPMRSRAIAKAVAAAVVVGVAVVAALAVARAVPRDLPSSTGPFAVGRAVVDLPLTGTGPPVTAWLWYPATADRAASARYVPDGWLGGVPPVLGPGLLLQDMSAVRTAVIADAPPADRGTARRLPVIVLVPGLGVEPWAYTTLAKDLASRGYRVAETVPATTPAAARAGRRVAGIEPDLTGAPDEVSRTLRVLTDDQAGDVTAFARRSERTRSVVA